MPVSVNAQCPVCGFAELREPPRDFLICPCCLTEFGYSDFDQSHDELRSKWISAGMPWRGEWEAPPPDWDPLARYRGERV